MKQVLATLCDRFFANMQRACAHPPQAVEPISAITMWCGRCGAVREITISTVGHRRPPWHPPSADRFPTHTEEQRI